jgi:hypothetical protein
MLSRKLRHILLKDKNKFVEFFEFIEFVE